MAFWPSRGVIGPKGSVLYWAADRINGMGHNYTGVSRVYTQPVHSWGMIGPNFMRKIVQSAVRLTNRQSHSGLYDFSIVMTISAKFSSRDRLLIGLLTSNRQCERGKKTTRAPPE